MQRRGRSLRKSRKPCHHHRRPRRLGVVQHAHILIVDGNVDVNCVILERASMKKRHHQQHHQCHHHLHQHQHQQRHLSTVIINRPKEKEPPTIIATLPSTKLQRDHHGKENDPSQQQHHRHPHRSTIKKKTTTIILRQQKMKIT